MRLAIEALAGEIYKVRQRAMSISLEEFKARLPIAHIVRLYLPLTRRGRDRWGCCPFHDEQTPSFHVVSDKGFYHCFGCGAHGDAIDFIMQFKGLNYDQAVRFLARVMDLPVPSQP